MSFVYLQRLACLIALGITPIITVIDRDLYLQVNLPNSCRVITDPGIAVKDSNSQGFPGELNWRPKISCASGLHFTRLGIPSARLLTFIDESEVHT